MKTKKTLCELCDEGFIRDNLEEYKKLVRKGKFVCRKCGRIARKEKQLCKPEKI